MRKARQHIPVLLLVILLPMVATGAAAAQEPAQHLHTQTTGGWLFMQDAIVFGNFNHQGSDRGGDEFVAPNWWMGMASRNTRRGQLTLTGMLSFDPATVGKKGYREIFQVGEAVDGQPLVDRQHPHDLFMQLAAVWSAPPTASTALTVAAAPAGEPALGPVAFIHRASAADNPTAPLGHHTLDSTHISFGVVTAAIDHGSWTVEGSVFNGREPDENRWDLNFDPLDSFSGRLWLRPAAGWEVQVSTGHLKDPEELEPGDVNRSTASLSWTRRTGADVSSVTVGYGRNDGDQDIRNAVFAEAARRVGSNGLYARFEGVQVETELLRTGLTLTGTAADLKDPVFAFTLGGVRDWLRLGGFEGGLGVDLTVYRVPTSLRPVYGSGPISFHLFLRLRPPAGPMGRMWNMRMSQPMAHGPSP